MYFDSCDLSTSHNQPERLNPEDACYKIYYRSDDGIYEKLEACICDSPNPEYKKNQGDIQK